MTLHRWANDETLLAFPTSLYQSDSKGLTGEELEFLLSPEDAGAIAEDSGDSESFNEINEFAGLFKTISNKLNQESCIEPTEDNPDSSPYYYFDIGFALSAYGCNGETADCGKWNKDSEYFFLGQADSLRWTGLVKGMLPSSSPDKLRVLACHPC